MLAGFTRHTEHHQKHTVVLKAHSIDLNRWATCPTAQLLLVYAVAAVSINRWMAGSNPLLVILYQSRRRQAPQHLCGMLLDSTFAHLCTFMPCRLQPRLQLSSCALYPAMPQHHPALEQQHSWDNPPCPPSGQQLPAVSSCNCCAEPRPSS